MSGEKKRKLKLKDMKHNELMCKVMRAEASEKRERRLGHFEGKGIEVTEF